MASNRWAHNRKILTENETNQIINLYNSGVSIEKILRQTDIGTTVIKRILKENNIVNKNAAFYSTKTINNNFFKTIDTEDKAYILGFLFADGNIDKNRNRISITVKESDIDILEKIKIAMDSKSIISKGFCKKLNKYSHKLSFTSELIKKDLINLGCVPCKSLILKFPTKDQVPEHLIHHFIRGYFDGDGCHGFYKTKYNTYRESVSFIGTEDFLNSLHAVFINFLNLPKRNLSVAGYSLVAKTIGYNCIQAAKIMNFMNVNATIKLERKHLNLQSHLIFKNNGNK
jgi:intein/homing endonuclease